jgi:hypothetical protein
LDVKAHTIQLKPKSIVVPAPNRRNVGFLKITADTENEGELTIFAVKAYDVTDGKTKKIAYEKSNLAVGPGEVLKLALAAKKKYTIEVQMGTNVNQASAYVLENWEVDGKSTVQELKTSTHFKSKDSQTSWDYDDYELTATVILDSLTTEAPALTHEQQEQLYNAVLEDYADIPYKADRIKKLKSDRYYNALQIKFAYAVTCHKAQGGQWSHVYLDQGYMTEDMLSPDYFRWLYTAFTRATETLYLVNWPKEQTE